MADKPRNHEIKDDQQLLSLWVSARPETTRRVYLAEANRFLGYLGRPLAEVTASLVVRYVSQMEGAPATRARRISSIKSLLKFAAGVNYVAVDLGAIIRIPRVTSRLHERILERDEVVDLLREASPGRNRILARFLYVSGCRISEAVGVRWRDLGPTGVTIFGKGSKVRTVALPKSMLGELALLRGPNEPDATHVFKGTRARKLSVRQARAIIAVAGIESIGKPVSPHWLRHAHASHALAAGAPIHLVKATLGHASLATVTLYTAVRPDLGSSMYLDS